MIRAGTHALSSGLHGGAVAVSTLLRHAPAEVLATLPDTVCRDLVMTTDKLGDDDCGLRSRVAACLAH